MLQIIAKHIFVVPLFFSPCFKLQRLRAEGDLKRQRYDLIRGRQNAVAVFNLDFLDHSPMYLWDRRDMHHKGKCFATREPRVLSAVLIGISALVWQYVTPCAGTIACRILWIANKYTHYMGVRFTEGFNQKQLQRQMAQYSGTWELGTPKGLSKTVLNSETVLFLRSISMWWIDLGTEVAVPNSQVVPVSQVVLKIGLTVYPDASKVLAIARLVWLTLFI